MRILFIFLLSCFSFNLNAQIYNGKKAASIINDAEKIMINDQSDFPAYIEFKKSSKIKVDELLARWKKEFAIEYVLLSKEKDQLGIEHIKFQQTIDRIPVEWGVFTIHAKNNVVISFSGCIYNNLSIQSENNINFVAALKTAKEIHNARLYMWEDQKEENLLKRIKNDPGASYFPREQKVWIKNGRELNLSYKISLYSKYPLAKKDYYINAANSKLLKVVDRIQTTDVVGTAVTRYSGTQTITTDSYNGSFRLRESSRGNGIATYNMQMTGDYGNAVDFTDDDNYWNNVNSSQDEVATDAHWATEKYYDYLLSTFGRNSIDNNGFALYNYVHADLTVLGLSNNVNAFWDGQRMTFGDGNSTYSPLTTVDITCHEITHGLTELTANLVYADESGAMNEGFSDIFGTVVEFYAKPSTANWTIGEDIGTAFRSMANPNQYNDPDTYHGMYWDFNNEVHQNSTVLSHWFYLLSVGGSGTNDIGNSYTVNGIGIENAARIAYRTLVYYLQPNATYSDARFYTIVAASDLFGACSAEVEAVTNAMYAVGIGAQYQPNVIADFTASITQTCQAPFSIQFENNSMNGNSFYWNFGDGTTSTDINPQHTYMNNGNYTVQLIVDGGTCGKDTLIKTNYISIDPQNPCIVVMPLNGTANTINSCTGTLYDGGGPNGNYIDNADAIITIAPAGANSVTLTFNLFDIEPGSGSYCDYDYVEIFDGPSTTGTSLGKYCNTTGTPGTIVSTGGALTLLLHSDPGVNKAGFEAVWTCEILNIPPVAQFNVQPINTCSGIISFIDQSLHNPTSWYWDFGDGTHSTLQNPEHEYLNNGNYNVSLVVANSYGSDTVLYSNIVSIARPEVPVVYNDSICLNQNASLVSVGDGSQVWYANSADTIPIYIGDTLLTSSLNQTTTFWVQNAYLHPSEYVGDTRSSTDGGFYNNSGQHYLVFDCFTPCKLVSVEVNANGAGIRNISLNNSQGNVLASRSIYIQNGISRILLDFDLPVQNDLRLTGPAYPNLWRNNNLVAFYPYAIPNVISIKASSVLNDPTHYYYYFYNWEIKIPDCFSAKVPVVAYVDNCSNTPSVNSDDFKIYPNPANDYILIQLVNQMNIKAISLIDQLGKKYPITLTKTNMENEYRINVNHLSSGVYFLELADDKIKHVTKIFIKN
ncbi:MAG TPA: M4 family metallopeptidase [Bacteroidales bacterium]|nr:M4 family metallopeptidase [Bacteroidales bacterium]